MILVFKIIEEKEAFSLRDFPGFRQDLSAWDGALVALIVRCGRKVKGRRQSVSLAYRLVCLSHCCIWSILYSFLKPALSVAMDNGKKAVDRTVKTTNQIANSDVTCRNLLNMDIHSIRQICCHQSAAGRVLVIGRISTRGLSEKTISLHVQSVESLPSLLPLPPKCSPV